MLRESYMGDDEFELEGLLLVILPQMKKTFR